MAELGDWNSKLGRKNFLKDANLAEVEVDMNSVFSRSDEPHTQQLRPSLAQKFAL